MIRYLKHEEIDKQKWDDCILNSPDHHIFVLSWYLDVCCKGWSAYVMGDYESVFPLAVKSKASIRYLYQPFFTRHFGMYSKSAFSDINAKQFLDRISDDYRFAEFCLHSSHKNLPENFQSKSRRYQELSLNEDYDKIASGFNKNAQRILKKNSNQVVQENIPALQIAGFIKKNLKEKDTGIDENNYNVLANLIEAAAINTQTYSWQIKDENDENTAAAFFMHSQNRIVYLKGASSETGKKNGSMHKLFDALIRKFSNTDTILDFGGSDAEGVARFFHSFGAKDSIYLQLRMNNLPIPLKWLKS